MLAIWQRRKWNGYSSNRMKKNGNDDEQTNVSCPHLCPGIRIVDQSWQCAVIWFHNKLQRACEVYEVCVKQG